jgi:hypothetical protein
MIDVGRYVVEAVREVKPFIDEAKRRGLRKQ